MKPNTVAYHLLICVVMVAFLECAAALTSPTIIPLRRRTPQPSNFSSFRNSLRTYYVEEAGQIHKISLYTNVYAYAADIFIGTPLQRLTVDVDTGSSTFAVATVDCPNCNKALPMYSATASSSWSTPSCSSPAGCGEFKLSYGDKSTLVGTWATDVINFGGYNTTATFGYVRTMTGSFVTLPYSGILGLAQNTKLMTCNPGCVPTLFDTLVSSLNIPNIFEMGLSLNSGFLSLGGYNLDNSSNASNYYWTDNTDPNFYGIKLMSMSVGNNSTKVSSKVQTIVDSGTSLLILTLDLYNSVTNNIINIMCNSSTTATVCKTLIKSPDGCIPTNLLSGIDMSDFPEILIDIAFAGVYAVSAKEYFIDFGNVTCFGIIPVDNTGQEQMQIFGDVFMRSFVSTVFDRKKDKIGFNGLNRRGDSAAWNKMWIYIGVGVGLLLMLVVSLLVVVYFRRRHHRHYVRQV